MKLVLLPRRAGGAVVAIVSGLAVTFGFASDSRKDSSSADPGAAVTDVSRRTEAPEGTDQAAKTDPSAVCGHINRSALLVGVTKYDNLGPDHQLQGPANDVQLMKRLLQERYQYPADGIVSLSEDEGTPARRPTRTNIEREFRQLVERVEEGDQVVVLLAGHGARQPESVPPDADYPEPDGIDEIFLPADVGVWKGFPERVPNAIVDNEIGTWLRAIAAKRAYTWVIFDCCHSGTMTRGSELVREVPPGMLVPLEELDKARERAVQRQAKTNAGSSVKRPSFVSPQPSPYLVAVYACRAHEQTPESLQPSGAQDAKYYGLLTYTLADILTRSSTSKAPLTYRELVQRVQVRYAGRPQGSPTPLIEGEGQDRIVLGTEQPMRSAWLLHRDQDGYKVNAGDLHGLTPGSILAVESPAGTETEPRLLGHVRVSRTWALDATVEPCAYGESPAVGEFPPLSSCKTVFIDYGLRRFKVAIDVTDELGAIRQDLQRALQPIADAKTGLVEWVRDPREADWLLRSDHDQIELIEASGNLPSFPLPPTNSRLLGESLRQDLERVFRARNLVTLASQLETGRYRGGSDVDVEVEVLLQKDRSSPVEVMPAPPGGRVFRPGNLISFRVHNESPSTRVDVTLLIVGTDLRIHAFYPRRYEVGKSLNPGETLTTPPPPGEIGKDPPFGPECLIVIATPASNPPFDFTVLAQSGLPLARYGDANPSLQSPLKELMESVVFRTGLRSGLEQSVADQYGLRILTWRTEPE